MRIMFLMACFVTTQLIAGVDQKLPNNHWSYYGEAFYKNLASKSVTKDSISIILNSQHASNPRMYDTIGACQGYCYSHTSVGYTQARKILFGEIYVLNDGRGTYVQDVYCGKKFPFRSVEEASGMHTEVNIEHTWPQSKFSGRYDKGTQKSDMHHLFLTDSDANNKRGNHEFGIAGSNVDELNVENCSLSKLVRANQGTVFEPPKSHRGNVARALFYFASHYGMTISKDQEAALREWSKNDPVDASEIQRHEMVAAHQKVRNPFIDHPELAETIKDF